MPKYLIQANYTEKGVQGLIKEGGTSRQAAIKELFESVGGKMDAFYYAFGETDVFVIADLPDNMSMTALALIVAASGGATVKTTVLLTPAEVDEAVKLTPSYRPPGK